MDPHIIDIGDSRLGAVEHELDDFLVRGRQSLASLQEQRGVLKKAHRKLLDTANTLGVSHRLMAAIGARLAADRRIVLGIAALVGVGVWFMY